MNSFGMDIERWLLTRICYWYYEKTKTQQEIADLEGLSRMKVSRLLQKARDEGVVKILIDYSGAFMELENRLMEKYGLQKAIVVNSPEVSSIKEKVAAAAAFFLENNLNDGNTVAVGWGTTLDLVSNFITLRNKKVTFSPIIGGHGKNEIDIHASSIAIKLAQKIGGESSFLLAPAFAQNEKQKEILINDRFIKEVLARSASADYALFSLGNPQEPGNSFIKSEYFSDEEIKLLHRENAVCDVVSILFLNNKGRPCCEQLTRRSIGIKPEELKRISVKICVVDGKSKHQTVKIALEAGYIDVLVLDLSMAEYLAA